MDLDLPWCSGHGDRLDVHLEHQLHSSFDLGFVASCSTLMSLCWFPAIIVAFSDDGGENHQTTFVEFGSCVHGAHANISLSWSIAFVTRIFL
jgi:hypothetical protein